jgi:hypothetical protein
MLPSGLRQHKIFHAMNGEIDIGEPFEGEPTEEERAELCTGLLDDIQAMSELALDEAVVDPMLDIMIATLAETGEELSPGIHAHLRKMIAWRFGGLDAMGTKFTEEYREMVKAHIQAELEKMRDYEGKLSELPDWDLAFQDIRILNQGLTEVWEGDDSAGLFDQEPDDDLDDDWEELPNEDEFPEDY